MCIYIYKTFNLRSELKCLLESTKVSASKYTIYSSTIVLIVLFGTFIYIKYVYNI